MIDGATLSILIVEARLLAAFGLPIALVNRAEATDTIPDPVKPGSALKVAE